MTSLACVLLAVIALNLTALTLLGLMVKLDGRRFLVQIEEDPEPCTCAPCTENRAFDWEAAERQMKQKR